tara:strand:- start:345 stop:1535 length:1191 start_codon:yes stop_codon:yes gene_type:complete
MEENEKLVEETTQEVRQGDPGDENVVKVDESKFESAGDDSIIKIDLSKPPTPIEDEVKESNANDSGVVAGTEDANATQEQEKVQPEAETQEAPVLEEITEETEDKVEEVIAEAQATGKALPENIQKLVDFMEDTGGDINDYVKLNQDYSKLDDSDLLFEYYKDIKPHLNTEEINFLMDDTFSYDEDVDEDIDVKRKKLALKEQVASAKSHLDGLKSKYYQEIKSGSKLTEEQKTAVSFFDKYNKESEVTQKTVKKNSDIFNQKTNNVFNNEFKGFEFNVGDKKYRFNVNNAEEVKNTQSDINNFTKKFLDKNDSLSDAQGYHKSLYTAMNADAVAKHFYEQGKADAMKNSIAKSKNVDMNPRQAHGVVEAGGLKVKVLGDTSSDFKFKIKNNKFKN